MPSEASALADFVASLAETRAALSCPACNKMFVKPVKFLVCLHTVCATHSSCKFCPVCRADVRASRLVSDDALQEACEVLGQLEALYKEGSADNAPQPSVTTRTPMVQLVPVDIANKNKQTSKKTTSSVEKNLKMVTADAEAKKVDRKNASVTTPKAERRDLRTSSRGTPKNSPALEKKNTKGETALHVACRCLKIDRIVELLEKGADPNTKDHAGWTPLHEVSQQGSLEAARLLLRAGALPAVPGLDNETPLHEAVRYGHADIAAELVAHAAPTDARNIKGETPMSLADAAMRARLCAASAAAPPPSACRALASGDAQLYVYCAAQHRTVARDLKRLARHHALHVETAFSSKTTHVIVETEADGSTPCTVLVLEAVLRGAWLLSSDWATHSSDTSLQRCEDYEVSGITSPEFAGHKRSRLNRAMKRPGLFDGCHFFFHMRRDCEITRSLVLSRPLLARLVVAGGGLVLRREPDPEAIPPAEQTVPYHAPAGALARCSHYIVFAETFEPMYNMAHLKALPVGWLLECIQKYELCEP